MIMCIISNTEDLKWRGRTSDEMRQMSKSLITEAIASPGWRDGPWEIGVVDDVCIAIAQPSDDDRYIVDQDVPPPIDDDDQDIPPSAVWWHRVGSGTTVDEIYDAASGIME